MSVTILMAAACIPSVALLAYIYHKDRTEKEPFSLLVKLFCLGALSCLPAVILEMILPAFNAFPEGSIAYLVVENFLVVGLAEEASKFLMLYLVTRRNKNFNCLFDGVLYAVVVSLGFATLENILYVTQFGMGNAVMRAITAVPGHMFDGVLMGYFYTFWHLYANCEIVEKHYAQMGLIDRIVQPQTKPGTYLALTLIVPIAAHGTYDFLCSLESLLGVLLFWAFLIFLYIFCFRKIALLSKNDQHQENIIAAILNQRYPYLYPRIRQAMQRQQMQYNPYTQVTYSPYSSQNNYSYQYRQAPQQPVAPYGAPQYPSDNGYHTPRY